MKMIRRLGQTLLVGSLSLVLTVGAMTLFAPGASAGRPPILLCGPTILWVCSGPGGPTVLFGGTICEKAAFEKQTGLTCVPYSG